MNIHNKTISIGLRLFEFYLPLWAAIIFNGYIYFKLINYLKSLHTNIDLRRLSLYPLILIFCWSFPTIHRLHSIFTDDNSPTLAFLHSVFESMQGILNAILY